MTLTLIASAVVGRSAAGKAITATFPLGLAREVRTDRKPDGTRTAQGVNYELDIHVTPAVPVTVRVSSSERFEVNATGGLVSRVRSGPDGVFVKGVGRFRQVNPVTFELDLERDQPMKAGEQYFLEVIPGFGA